MVYFEEYVITYYLMLIIYVNELIEEYPLLLADILDTAVLILTEKGSYTEKVSKCNAASIL